MNLREFEIIKNIPSFENKINYDCLFSISYFIYKWHKNGYPFKNSSFQILNNIIS